LDNKDEETEIGLSLADEIKKGKKSFQLVCQNELADQYASTQGYSPEDIVRVDGGCAATVDRACQSAFENDLTLCHVKLEEGGDEKKRWSRAHEVASKMWEHVSQNGILITLWCGGDNKKNAMMGVAFRKGQVPISE
jgi:hypothetical protein